MSLKKRTRRISVDKEYPQLTFEQGLDLAVSAKRAEGLRPRTLLDYEKHFRYFTNWLSEYHPEIVFLNDVTTASIRDFVLYMKHDAKRYAGHKNINADKQRVGLSDTTVNIRLRTLKALFNQLERDDLVEFNPVDNVKLMRQDEDLTNALSDEEIKAILAQPDRKDFVGFRDYVAICLMLDSGLRISELLSLRAEDLDFQTRFITLPADRNKNRKPRLVPISASVVKMILQLISENRAHFTTDRLFLSCFGDPIGPNHFNKRLKYYGERAGVEGKKMTAHVYRHTWARGMVLNGADIFMIQKMGGWADIRTMRKYIQMDTREIRVSHDNNSPINNYIRKGGA